MKQQPYKGGPRFGDADGEPLPSPSTQRQDGYSGAPTYQGNQNRGASAVGPDGDGAVFPEVYGGGNGFQNRGGRKGKARGNAAGPGAGATSPGGSPS